MPAHDLDRLAAAALLAALPESERAQVAAAAAVRELAARDVAFHQGDRPAALWIVDRGRLKLSKVGPDGGEVVVHFAGPGQAVAVLALFGDAAYPVSAQAVEPSRLWVWPRPVLARLAVEAPALLSVAGRQMAERAQEMQERFRELATLRVSQRLARALLRLARQAGRRIDEGVLIDLPLTRQDLAEMTGTTLFTVSRQLSEWESQGLLVLGRGRVVVRAPHRLVALAEDLPEPG